MEEQHLKNGTKLQEGKYRIIRFINSGGFGCTYEAIHTLLDTHVAIKEFFVKDFCNRDEHTSRISVATNSKRELVAKLKKKFIEEAKALFRMHHEGIVRVIDIFEENGTAYYVMDYVDGKSLQDILLARGPLSEKLAIGYILQVCNALEYVHSQNRLHLDIKPGNIMVDKKGKTILIDFGASKHYDEKNGENTSTLLGVNTKGYAPVEQSTQSFTTFNPATDIYSLGATLYKLLTGITPPDSVLLLSEEARLKPLPSTISRNTRNVVMKAMAIKRKNRYQSVKDFADALQNKTENHKGEVEATVIDTGDNDNTQKDKFNLQPSVKLVETSGKTKKNYNKTIIIVIIAVIITSLSSFFITHSCTNNSDYDYAADTAVIDSTDIYAEDSIAEDSTVADSAYAEPLAEEVSPKPQVITTSSKRQKSYPEYEEFDSLAYDGVDSAAYY